MFCSPDRTLLAIEPQRYCQPAIRAQSGARNIQGAQAANQIRFGRNLRAFLFLGMRYFVIVLVLSTATKCRPDHVFMELFALLRRQYLVDTD